MKQVQPRIAVFGREVRRRRMALGLTLEVLAQTSKLTPNYIGSVEKGYRDPSLTTIHAIARGLDVPLGELVAASSGLSPVSLEGARLFELASASVQSAILVLLATQRPKRRPSQ